MLSLLKGRGCSLLLQAMPGLQHNAAAISASLFLEGGALGNVYIYSALYAAGAPSRHSSPLLGKMYATNAAM